MTSILETAEEAIESSIQHNGIAYCEDTPENRAFLETECGDYVEIGSIIEYWSTVEDGSEWRVHIKIEGMIEKAS